ncbi:lantibiotic immunity ABC transporter MutE/EpiE family permease subunit [Lactobacillus sp. ESL0791]|uniref:lantibiotic immunity ABC transporter MutE/EpiE family permease subunit n=1 Tax=Lactobacillus sp. ESL0791 TaxID=2983234 RepID=UPI0023F85E03|nr:lantibiotic immunity ABC transporter MutE/EpiE family permease subunit [Lactobacillus sp. ESL0791]MDF7639819.1 lantibiotic immunity ABC transporter MutE/EpiE family permease subunit [Lactobacillus sp. ESL0791]
MNKIQALAKAEFIKNRHSFIYSSFCLLPVITTILAIILLAGEQLQLAIFNWWYMVLLPVELALICIYLLESDKKQHYFNLQLLPAASVKVGLAKILTGCAYLLFTNTVIMILVLLAGWLFGSQLAFSQELAATCLLTVCFAWQIPLGMFLEFKLPAPFTLIILFALNIFFSGQGFAGSRTLWLIPFSIPARLMAAVLGVNPNGIPLTKNSFLFDPGVILPGVFINILLLGISITMFLHCFKEDKL